MNIIKQFFLTLLVLTGATFGTQISAAGRGPKRPAAPAKKPAAPVKKPTPMTAPVSAQEQRALEESKKEAERKAREQVERTAQEEKELQQALELSRTDIDRKKEEDINLQAILAESVRLENERQAKMADAQKQLKNAGWTSADSGKKSAWEKYQKLLYTPHIEKANFGAWLDPEYDQLGRDREVLQSLLDLYGKAIEDAYLNAYDILSVPQKKELWNLMNEIFPVLVGSGKITADLLKPINQIIVKVHALSPALADALYAQYDFLAKAVQLKIDEQLAQRLAQQTPTPSREPEQKKNADQAQAASTIKRVNIVWVPVRAQTDTTCGLHAVNNPHQFKQALLDQKTSAQRNQCMTTGLTGVALELSKQKESNMLDALTIQRMGDALGINKDSYSILPNVVQNVPDFTATVPMPTPTSPFIPHNLGASLKALNTQPKAVHNFVLGTMTINPATRTGTSGHWIGVTAEKNSDTLTLYAMDSAGGKPQELVQALQTIIQKSNFEALQLTATVAENIVAVQRYLSTNDFAGALADLAAIITSAQKANILNNSAFALTMNNGTKVPVKTIIQGLLNNITILDSGEWAAQAQRMLATL